MRRVAAVLWVILGIFSVAVRSLLPVSRPPTQAPRSGPLSKPHMIDRAQDMNPPLQLTIPNTSSSPTRCSNSCSQCGFLELYRNIPGAKQAIGVLYELSGFPEALTWLECHASVRLSILATYLLSKSQVSF